LLLLLLPLGVANGFCGFEHNSSANWARFAWRWFQVRLRAQIAAHLAALEALLTHFEVRGAQIQLETIGWLGDHCKAKG